MPSFHIRPGSAAAGDSARLVSYFDSQLPWLATVGSGAQWGSSPFSGKDDVQAKYKAQAEQSERCEGQPLGPKWIRYFVAEVDVAADSVEPELRQLGREVSGLAEGIIRIPVAIMSLLAESPDYVRSILPERDETDQFVYLGHLLSDRKASSIGKGAGAVLIGCAVDEAKRLGARRICGDCWRGNDRRLVKYYEKHGFTAIGDFGIEAKDDWPGAVFEMRLD